MLNQRFRRVSALSTLLVTTALAATACTSPAQPAPTAAPAAASPTPTPSPTPTGPQPPAQPAAMANNDEAGALALAQYFVTDLYRYTVTTGDLESWTSLSDPDCGFCSSVAAEAGTIEDPVQPAEDSEVIESATIATITPGAKYTADLQALQRTSAPAPTDGSAAAPPVETRYRLLISILWEDGWRIQAIDIRPAGV